MSLPSQFLCAAIVLCLMTCMGGTASAQSKNSASRPSAGDQRLTVTVNDENGVAVESARVFLQSPATSAFRRCETDFSGHCTFQRLAPGTYQLRVEKQGFYALPPTPVNVGQTPGMDVKLAHLQEVREVVNVVESPPGIDLTQTASTEQLTGMDVLNIPYPSTHDYRNVLNFIPGVVQDNSGQPHIAGSETYETLTLLDGFNLTQPANGMLLLRVSTDAIRAINVENSRISAEHGKGSGGVLSINTGIGDDHYRFAATNFLPSFQVKQGFAFDKVVPRVTFSGPISKGRIWFFEGFDGQFQNKIIPELKIPPNNDHFWRVGTLTKFQLNLAPGNILTASYLFNRQHDQYLGLSIFAPASSTPSDEERGDFAMIRDQVYFSGGQLLDFGFNFDEYGSNINPHGAGAFINNGLASAGGYYLTADTTARRWQGIVNLALAPYHWHGRHEVKFGVDFDRLAYNPIIQRSPIIYLRPGAPSLPPGTNCLQIMPSPCSRFTAFQTGPQAEKHNGEASAYLQDRWSPTDRIVIEAGLRYDWDEIVADSLISPRLAGTYLLDRTGNTKLSAGVGIFYDATNMVLVSRPFEGRRIDYFFNSQGFLSGPPIFMSFNVDQGTLLAPRFLNWSLALERRLPHDVYMKAEFIQRHGTHGFVYNLPPGSPPNSANFFLQNTREDHYDSFQISARKNFHQTYSVTAAYTRSKSRSNQVFDFNVDNPLYTQQLPGPFPWDAPNRFLATGIVPGWVPLFKHVDIEYSAEARTGFPFYVVNSQQQLVEPPGSRRFPPFFSLNLFLEKRFDFHGRHWAIRGGFDDITGRQNPAQVNNNIDSPEFLMFGALDHRAFTARIRFLGRK
jgi:Carboxypeptidase regulatory-like domain/TonB dependent receptor